MKSSSRWILAVLLLISLSAGSLAQRGGWRQASESQLASLLPARATVEKEHIEIEMRTATGIVDSHGRFIAGVVLLTAGYSAEGKYSHYLLVQAPIKIGGVELKPGEYAFGWTREDSGEALRVHFHVAETGALVGTAEAKHMTGTQPVESLHIWPPSERSIIQIGRFAIPYEIKEL